MSNTFCAIFPQVVIWTEIKFTFKIFFTCEKFLVSSAVFNFIVANVLKGNVLHA